MDECLCIAAALSRRGEGKEGHTHTHTRTLQRRVVYRKSAGKVPGAGRGSYDASMNALMDRMGKAARGERCSGQNRVDRILQQAMTVPKKKQRPDSCSCGDDCATAECHLVHHHITPLRSRSPGPA